jgi:hypothetical protein
MLSENICSLKDDIPFVFAELELVVLGLLVCVVFVWLFLWVFCVCDFLGVFCGFVFLCWVVVWGFFSCCCCGCRIFFHHDCEMSPIWLIKILVLFSMLFCFAFAES